MQIANPGCDTKGDPPQGKCDLIGLFTVVVSLNSFAGLTEGYRGFQARLDYSAGLVLTDTRIAWPDCGFPAPFESPGVVVIGCTTAPPPVNESVHTGPLAELDFACKQNAGTETIEMPHGPGAPAPGSTHLVDELAIEVIDKDPSPETLTINCLFKVGGFSTDLGPGGSHGELDVPPAQDSYHVFPGFAAGGAIALIVLASAGWLLLRRRPTS